MLLYLEKGRRALFLTESVLLVLSVIAMILLAVGQIVLRNFFGYGIIWFESAVRVLVFWTALLGAMRATRANKHIAIDVLVKWLPQPYRLLIRRLTLGFAALVCLGMVAFGYRFVAFSYENGGIAFAAIPDWACQVIIPVAFMVMACRFLSKALFEPLSD